MERLERVLLLCLLVLVLSMLPAGASLPLAHAPAETPPPAETDTLSGEESRLPTPRSGALVEMGGEDGHFDRVRQIDGQHALAVLQLYAHGGLLRRRIASSI